MILVDGISEHLFLDILEPSGLTLVRVVVLVFFTMETHNFHKSYFVLNHNSKARSK